MTAVYTGSITDGLSTTGLTHTSGTTVLDSATNTYTGATTITGGTLQGGVAGAFSAGSATTANTGGTVDLGGFAQTINTVNLAGGTIQNGSLTGDVNLDGRHDRQHPRRRRDGGRRPPARRPCRGRTPIRARRDDLQRHAGRRGIERPQRQFGHGGDRNARYQRLLADDRLKLTGIGTVTNSIGGAVTLTTGGGNTSTEFAGIIQNQGQTELDQGRDGRFNASFDGQSYSARLESGYHIALAALTLTPYGALQAQSFQAPAYGETAANGANSFALHYLRRAKRHRYALRTRRLDGQDLRPARRQRDETVRPRRLGA